jgi:hypothetical protein
MLSRRDLILSGAFAPSLGPANPAAQRSAASSDSAIEQELLAIRDALRDLRGGGLTVSAEITDIRERQRTHLKTYQKIPDCIDVGVRVWERLYDWHLENHLPLKVSRMGDGHLEMEVMLTMLILRSDIADAQIGVPYDR